MIARHIHAAAPPPELDHHAREQQLIETFWKAEQNPVAGMAKKVTRFRETRKSMSQAALFQQVQQPVMDVPVADYSFHAGDIVGTVEKLLKAFRDKKVELETVEAKAVSDFERGTPTAIALYRTVSCSESKRSAYAEREI